MAASVVKAFPYFFVGTFIEAQPPKPSSTPTSKFPYFFVGTFIEAETASAMESHLGLRFPYFFVGTFIEATA